MKTHYSKELKVDAYPVLGSYLSKDGTKNALIRVRINSKKAAKRQIKEIRYDIPVEDERDNKISIIPIQFSSNKYNIQIKRRIAEIEERVKFAVYHFLSHNEKFDTKKIKDFVYGEMEQNARIFSSEYETDPEIVNLFQQHLPDEYKDEKIPRDVVNKFAALPEDAFINDETGEFIEMEDIINGIEVEHIEKQRVAELNELTINERYKRGLYDKSNIFEVFGFCLSNESNKNRPIAIGTYPSLLVRLADYRYNRNPKEHINDFNIEWVNEFLKFLRDEGYATKRIKKFNPFTVNKYANEFILSDRLPYTYQSFDKQVKHLNFFIDKLQEYKIIPRAILDTRDIKTTNYVEKNGSIYSRSSHSLLQSEIHQLMNARLTGKLETARIMFLIQTLAGGLRNDEFTNRHFKLKKAGGVYYFSFYANKVSEFQENPIIDGYTNVVLEQINYVLPDFLSVEEYRESIKEVAKKVGLDREIRYRIPMANGKAEPIDEPIYEFINPYWCRKSFVKLGKSLGWSDGLIASFTGHSNPVTMNNHYFDKLSFDDKLQLMKQQQRIP